MKRSEHLRDRLGRPLPGATADDPRVVPSVEEAAHIEAGTCLARAAEYLEAGMPFHAHEIFEMRWRCAPREERDLWQALAQWAAALVHDARGNPRGGVALRARSVPVLAEWAGRAQSQGPRNSQGHLALPTGQRLDLGRIVGEPESPRLVFVEPVQ